jgi:hypothetical protein
MQIKDRAGFYLVIPSNTVKTFDEVIEHEVYGSVRMVIHRAVANTSLTQREKTREILARLEPDPTIRFTGDFIYLLDKHGMVLDVL